MRKTITAIVLACSSVFFMGCSYGDSRYYEPNADGAGNAPKVAVSAQAPSQPASQSFSFTLSPQGVGEWHLEELLLSTPINVNGTKVEARISSRPYLSKTSVEMIYNAVDVKGDYDPKTRQLKADYTVINNEKSPALVYEQNGFGTMTGTVSEDGKTISVRVEGEKTSRTRENGRELSATTNKTLYDFTVPIK